MDMDKILARLSVPGLILLAAGAALGFISRVIAGKLFPKWGEKGVTALQWAGLALAILASLILLDFIQI